MLRLGSLTRLFRKIGLKNTNFLSTYQMPVVQSEKETVIILLQHILLTKIVLKET